MAFTAIASRFVFCSLAERILSANIDSLWGLFELHNTHIHRDLLTDGKDRDVRGNYKYLTV